MEPGAEQLLGHTAAEAAGQPVAELLGLEDAAGPEERHMALPVRDRDGSLLTLPVSSYPLADDMAGCETRPGSILVVGPPPTGDALQERDALSTWTLEASPLALTVYDTDLRCVWQSDRMRRLSGLSDEERRGHRLTDVLPTPDSARWEERVRRALLTGEEQTDEIRSSNPAASPTRVFGVSATPLRDERGQTLGVCTTVTDVTRASRDRERLALLNDASVRVGSTLDVTQTGRELTEVVVPRFADFARVDLLEVLLRGDEPAPGPIAGAVRLRRIAELNLFEGVLEAQTTAGDSDVYLVNSPAALCLASGRSAMYRTEDPVIRAWAALSPARQAKIARFGTHSWMLLPVRAAEQRSAWSCSPEPARLQSPSSPATSPWPRIWWPGRRCAWTTRGGSPGSGRRHSRFSEVCFRAGCRTSRRCRWPRAICPRHRASGWGATGTT